MSLPAQADSQKPTYQDDLLPLLRTSCLNCHNPDKKKAGLDLSTYATMMAGSDNGKVVKPGDPSGSMLFKTVTHAEEPFMPKSGDKLPDAQLNVFKKWIAIGAPETSDSKVTVAKANNLGVVVAKIGRPVGPPPMPTINLPIDPVIHTSRPGAILSIAASPWAPLVALGGQHQIVLYDTRNLDLLGILPFDAGQINVLRFSKDGSLLLAAGGQAAQSGKALLYDVRQGKKVGEVGNEFDAILTADLSPDHSIVAVGTPNKVLKAYNAVDGKLIYSIKKHTDWVTACAFSPDGVLLASGDRAGNLYVWESKTGRDFYTLSGHKGAITAVAFRDDGNVLASASEDGTVKLWNMQDGSQMASQTCHQGGVTCLAFAHDGRIVTCGRDNAASLWGPELDNGKPSERFNDVALQCAFSDDGKRIIAGDWTGSVKVFNADGLKKVAEITADPAAPADRLAEAQKHAEDLQSIHDRLALNASRSKAALDRANAELAIARQGKGAKEVTDAMQQVAPFKLRARKTVEELQAVKNDLVRRTNELARLQQERTQLTIALENAPKGQRNPLRQRLLQNEKQTREAVAQKTQAQKQIKPHENAATQAAEKAKEAESILTAALAAADPAAKALPQKLAATQAATSDYASAKSASDSAAAKLTEARGEVDRLKARIASAPATQPTARS